MKKILPKLFLLVIFLCGFAPSTFAQFDGGVMAPPPDRMGDDVVVKSDKKQEEKKETVVLGSVKGIVLDSKTLTPLEGVVIKALSLPDSTFAGSASTDSLGYFSVKNLKVGKYFFSTNQIGYSEAFGAIEITAKSTKLNVGNVLIKQTDIILGEGAIVTANAIQVTVVEDTLVYNANAFRVAEGSMLEDLIKKLPGAEISDEGTITINGKEVKKILVDGKEFFSDDPKVASKNLPANMVNKLKNYDRKSDFARTTGIDDGEEETVLDLEVKKGMKQGWVGNAVAGKGSEDRYTTSLSANRFRDKSYFSIITQGNNTNNQGASEMQDAGRGRGGSGAGNGITASKTFGTSFAKDVTENLKFGGDVRYGTSDNDASSKSRSETHYDDGTNAYGSSLGVSNRNRNDFNFNGRLEWKPDTMTTLIFRPNISTSGTKTWSNSSSESWNDSTDINNNISKSTSDNSSYRFGGQLELTRKLNSRGRNFNINLNYSYQSGNQESYSNSQQRYYLQSDRDTSYYRYSDGKTTNNNISVGFSYSEPVFTKSFLQLSYTFNYSKSTSNRYGYQQVPEDGIDFDSFVPDWTGYVGRQYADSTLSSCYENTYITQRIGLNMRHITDKYNLSYGVNLNPQSSKTNNIFGPNMDRGVQTQTVLNWSPNVNLRYRFDKMTNLRVEYRGSSNAPSLDNLQEVISKTDPQNIKYGNPTLKPSFTHNLDANFRTYNQETRRSLMANGSFSTTQNNVANMTLYDQGTGATISKLMNVDGNWNTRAMFGFNMPLDKENKFNLSSFSHASYNENVSFNQTSLDNVDFEAITSDDMNQYISLAKKSRTHNLTLTERVQSSFRNSWFEFTLNGNITYNKVTGYSNTTNNRETYTYRSGGSTNITMPWSIYLSTDCNYTHRQGFSSGLKNNETMWNAQLSKSMLTGNALTLRFNIYDILREQSNVSRSLSNLTISDTESNALGAYWMISLVYKFNTLGKNAGNRDGNRRDRDGHFGGPPPGGGFGGGGAPGGGGPM
ncbi:MAG: TonB-dependent receptor [Bacteroidaceae bacterium]|nr:TonB-dependent receptor [Bacteroidaceae bacterium]